MIGYDVGMFLKPWPSNYGRTMPFGAIYANGERWAMNTDGRSALFVRCDDTRVPGLQPGDSRASDLETRLHTWLTAPLLDSVTVRLNDLKEWAGPFQPWEVDCDCEEGCDECEGERTRPNPLARDRRGWVLTVPLNQNLLAFILRGVPPTPDVRIADLSRVQSPGQQRMLAIDGGMWRALVMGVRTLGDEVTNYWPRFPQVSV